MSIKNELDKLLGKLKAAWEKLKKSIIDGDSSGGQDSDSGTKPDGDSDTPITIKPIKLPEPSLASCWEGDNAQTRHMNELSFHFTDETVEKRLKWAKDRGCNTIHWFVCNQGDGEGSGYSIYTGSPSIGNYDKYTVQRMAKRIQMANKMGFAVVLWLLADDSSKWNSIILENINGYVNDLKESGLLDMASAVVLGLEMNEYIKSKSVAKALSDAVRKVYSGPIGTHHKSGSGEFAAYGDYLFWQMAPKQGVEAIKRSVKAAQDYGKPVIAFELERNPNRTSCNAALKVGAKGVGNW